MNHHRPDWISLTRAEEFPRRRPDDWPAPFTFIELGVDRITVEHDLVEADRITIRAHGPHPEDSGGVELDMDPDAARVLARELQRHAEACLRRDAGHELTLRSIASVAGIPLDEMTVWDPRLPMGGNREETVKKSRVLLWKGHCSVHQMFRAEHVQLFRHQHQHFLHRSFRWRDQTSEVSIRRNDQSTPACRRHKRLRAGS